MALPLFISTSAHTRGNFHWSSPVKASAILHSSFLASPVPSNYTILHHYQCWLLYRTTCLIFSSNSIKTWLCKVYAFFDMLCMFTFNILSLVTIEIKSKGTPWDHDDSVIGILSLLEILLLRPQLSLHCNDILHGIPVLQIK